MWFNRAITTDFQIWVFENKKYVNIDNRKETWFYSAQIEHFFWKLFFFKYFLNNGKPAASQHWRSPQCVCLPGSPRSALLFTNSLLRPAKLGFQRKARKAKFHKKRHFFKTSRFCSILSSKKVELAVEERLWAACNPPKTRMACSSLYSVFVASKIFTLQSRDRLFWSVGAGWLR